MTYDEFIHNIVTERVKDPLNLFLSYAHREALICRLIVGALKTRGHYVWFDELNIRHGDDWRVEILKGIERSNGVLAMISKDAVRPGGVCLDELSIAVGVRGGNIRSILLEKDVKPPPTIAYRQWEDMTQWQEFKKRFAQEEEILDDIDFQKWFREKINLLLAMLETQENREFEGQITTIRNLLPLLFTGNSKQSYLLKEFHIERIWLREKVDRWLEDPGSESICVIYGDPGIGKSAFAAHYAHYNGRVAAAFFCEKGHGALSSPEAVIQTLSYLLACRIEDYREYLCDFLADKGTFGYLNADELFEVLIATPLRNLIWGERPVECILIDGIDETGDSEKNTLSSVLGKYKDRLPGWLKLLVLSRNITSVQKWFGTVRHIDLTREIQENRDDLEQFVRERLRNLNTDEETREKATKAIVNRSDGVFLYAKMALNAILDGRITPEEADTFPCGLNEIFLQWFQWYFPDIQMYNEMIRPALNLVIASQTAIPEEEIMIVLGWRQRQIEGWKRPLQVHLKESVDAFAKTSISFNHLFISEWLCSSDAGEYQIYADDGIIDLAECFNEVLNEEDPEITEFEALFALDIMEQASGLQRSMRRMYKNAMRNEALMKRQEKLGKECCNWNHFVLARRYLHNALRIAECRCGEEASVENRKHLFICKSRMASIERTLGHDKKSKQIYEEALTIARQNHSERGFPEDMRRVAVSLFGIADSISEPDEQIPYYQEAKELLESAISLSGKESVSEELSTTDENEQNEKELLLRGLAIAYNRLAEISMKKRNYPEAAALYQEDVKISLQLAMETGKPEARRDLAVSYYKLAKVCNKCGYKRRGKKYFEQALLTMEYLVKERGQPDDIRGLSVLLNAKELFMDANVKMESSESDGPGEPLVSYQRALSMSRDLIQKFGLMCDHLQEAAILANIGNIFSSSGNMEEARIKWREALDIYEKFDTKEAVTLKQMLKDNEV